MTLLIPNMISWWAIIRIKSLLTFDFSLAETCEVFFLVSSPIILVYKLISQQLLTKDLKFIILHNMYVHLIDKF